MRIVLMVEGFTEKEKVLRDFLKRWLDPRLPQPIGIQAVRFHGSGDYLDNIATKTQWHLESEGTLAVFGLLDLYGLPPQITGNFPRHADRDTKIELARRQIMNLIAEPYRPHFRQHFAVHETEAWLLSDPRIFPPDIASALSSYDTNHPERIDFEEPPAQLLNRLWRRNRGRQYKKVTESRNRFPRLDPSLVYDRCPHFRQMMDEMLEFARRA
ncbi:MAG: DUF4276 family protein [Anaerolineae bacterium]|nr:DUF4276 family protein [Anaerolineae bacterium]